MSKTERTWQAPAEGTGGYRWVLLGGVWLAYFCFGLVGASMAPLIPAVRSDLGVSNATMGAILGAWPLVYIVAAIPCGVLLDRLRPRTSLMIGAAVVGLSALLRGLAWDEVSLFVAVGLFGVGGPLISVGAPKLTAQWFAGRGRGVAIGIYTTGPALGGAAALALTPGVLMPALGQDWRMVMLVYAAAGFAGGAIWFMIASHPLATPATGDGRVRFDKKALLQILDMPAVQVVLAMGAGIFFVNHGLNNWLPEILRNKGMSAAQAGYWASVTMIVGILGSLVVPRYAVPRWRLGLLGLIFAAMLTAGLLLLLPVGPVLVVPLVLVGIARTSATAIVMLLLIELPGIRGDRHGMVGGVFFVAAEMGGVLGPLTIGVLSEQSAGFDTSLWAIAAASAALIGLAGLLAVIERRAPGPLRG